MSGKRLFGTIINRIRTNILFVNIKYRITFVEQIERIMKTFKDIDYIHGLGEYLDNNKITWFNNGNDTINITVKNDAQFFRIAFTFRKYFDRINTPIPC